MKIASFCFLLSVILYWSCSQKKGDPTLFELMEHQHTGIDFENRIEEDDALNVFEFDYIYNGGGVAVGDFNQDA